MTLQVIEKQHTLTKAGVDSGIDGTSSNSPDPLSTLTTFELSYISPILTYYKTMLILQTNMPYKIINVN